MSKLRSLLSLFMILAITSFSIVATSAFFSDSETSTANTFRAGAIDLKVDNQSYYNGEFWQETSWDLDDLTGQVFFDFTDLKPGDWGEDTISIHVNDNNAWACASMELTHDDDGTCTEPEVEDDPNCIDSDEELLDGELGENIEIIFWTDDGDNVLEDDENTFFEGTVRELFDGQTWALAHSDTQSALLDPNDLTENGELIGTDTYYIAKAWCFGDLTKEPLAQDLVNDQRTPANTNGGIVCSENGLNNATQTDFVMGDIEFYAEQSRHNDNFICPDTQIDTLLWIIGDEEETQLDNPVDELNFTGTFGVFPTPPAIGADYTHTITQPVDDDNDKSFPWNTNYGADYARNIIVEFSFDGPVTIPATLTVGWSPGRSANEAKEIYLDGFYEWTTGPHLGISTPGWWNNMPRYYDSYDFDLTPGDHTLEFRHLYGDGTLWDFIKLEKQ